MKYLLLGYKYICNLYIYTGELQKKQMFLSSITKMKQFIYLFILMTSYQKSVISDSMFKTLSIVKLIQKQ